MMLMDKDRLVIYPNDPHTESIVYDLLLIGYKTQP